MGSVFTVELPMELTDESAVKKQDAPIARESLNGVKVLTPAYLPGGAPLFIP